MKTRSDLYFHPRKISWKLFLKICLGNQVCNGREDDVGLVEAHDAFGFRVDTREKQEERNIY